MQNKKRDEMKANIQIEGAKQKRSSKKTEQEN